MSFRAVRKGKTSPTLQNTTDSKKLEYGPGTINACCPSSLWFAIGGQSISNVLVSTVYAPRCKVFWLLTEIFVFTVHPGALEI